MRLSLTVIAHGDAAETFHRHLPLWKGLGVDDGSCLVLSPVNDPIKCRAWVNYQVGQASHAGPDAKARLEWLLKYLSRFEDVTHHLIFEYDSFCTAPAPPRQLEGGLSGILFRNKEPERFSAVVYPNPPWMIDHTSLLKMTEAFAQNPTITQGGFADRWLAAVAVQARVPIMEYEYPGFSRGTITEADYPALERAKLWGATMFHGVKDKRTLDLILK